MKQIVLMYHDIVRHDCSESGFQSPTALKYKVNSAEFEKQVAAINAYIEEKGLSKSVVEFTFDDGGVSFLTEAAPILEKYGFRGIFFIATAFIGTSGFLTVQQIKELAARGHIIGSHSHSHPKRMSAINKPEIFDEWRYSSMILNEILSQNITVASIPNGYSSKAVLNAMSNVGLDTIYTSKPTIKVRKFKTSKVIGRYAVTDNMTTASVLSILNSPVHRFRMESRALLLSVAKYILGPAYLTIRKKILVG